MPASCRRRAVAEPRYASRVVPGATSRSVTAGRREVATPSVASILAAGTAPGSGVSELPDSVRDGAEAVGPFHTTHTGPGGCVLLGPAAFSNERTLCRTILHAQRASPLMRESAQATRTLKIRSPPSANTPSVQAGRSGSSFSSLWSQTSAAGGFVRHVTRGSCHSTRACPRVACARALARPVQCW